MTRRLTPGSPRLSAAIRFGELLTRRMAEREVGQGVVKAAAGVSRASVVEWRNGRNLPTLEVALRVAEALQEPRLAEIVRKARTFACQRCGWPVLNERGFPKRYCSAACRVLGASTKAGPDKAEQAVQILRNELLRVGPVRKQQIGRAATLVDDYQAPTTAALQAVDAYQTAVAGMCGACEPDGLCRTPECPLRGVSPLPLESRQVDVETAVKPAGRWGQPGASERFSDQLRKRWAEPGRKDAQAARSCAFWAHRDRAEAGRKVSEARRRGIAARSVT